ncbi:hypothetical protein GCM10020255_014540 [Rhodococcus baikonurensis]
MAYSFIQSPIEADVPAGHSPKQEPHRWHAGSLDVRFCARDKGSRAKASSRRNHASMATAAMTKTMTTNATATIAAIPVTGKRLTVEGSGSDNPDVWGASGGVLPA